MKNKYIINSLLIFLIFVSSFPRLLASQHEIVVSSVYTQDIYPLKKYKAQRKKMVLALSGGGVRGLAHLGVLEVLERENIKIDGIAGVSVGALIGGLYAGGYSTDEISFRLREIDLGNMMVDQPERRSLLLARKSEFSRHFIELRLTKELTPIMPGAISPGQKLYRRLLDLTLDLPYRSIEDWQELPIPLAILATNLQNGNPVVFNGGDVTPAIRASMAVPLLFDPLSLDSLQLVDGGLTSNIPVDIARQMGGDIVVAVDLTAELALIEPPFQPWQIVDQATTILERDADEIALSKSDLIVKPDLPLDWDEGDVVETLVDAGRKAMRDALPRLRALMEINSTVDQNKQLYVKDLILPHNFDTDKIHPEMWVESWVSLNDIKRSLSDIITNNTVLNASAIYDSLNSSLTLKVSQTPFLSDVEIIGNKVVPDSILTQKFSNLLGRRLDYDETRFTLKNILSEYRIRGFPVAALNLVEFDTVSNVLIISIDEGELNNIEFRGLRQVRDRSLKREIPLKKGDLITRRGVTKGISNLFATGLFRSVYPVLRRDGQQGSGWNLVIYLQEHPSPPLRLGLAYQAQIRVRGFAELTLNSPFSYAARMVLFSSVGELDDEHKISFMIDKFSGTPLLYDLTIGFKSRERSEYSRQHHKLEKYYEEKWGVKIEIGGQALSWGLIAATARSEKHINQYNLQNNQYHLSAIGAKLAFDTHDRYPYPNHGIRFDSAVEFAGDFIASDAEFVRVWSSLESTFPLADRYTLSIRMLGRTADRTTPRDEQFRLGGIHEFPGLNLDEMIGLVQIAGGIDLRFDLLSRMLSDTYLGLRLDSGRSWEDPEAHIIGRDMLASGSVYFVFDTILGPLHLQLSRLFPARGISGQSIFFIQAGNLF